MGNVSMEASQINYRGGETKMSVEQALKETSGEAAAIAQLQTDVGNLQTTKANQITIAPVFNAEIAYDPGDLVYYNGLTYRCVNAHEGEWDADDFAATTISGELATLKSGLTDLEAIVGTVASMTDLDPKITYNYNLLTKIGNVIILAVSAGNIDNGAKIGTVPLDYRPAAETAYLPHGSSKDANGVYRYSTIKVSNNGEVYAYNDINEKMSVLMGMFMWAV